MSYQDPTRSVTHQGVFWPRRNWAMKKLLDMTAYPRRLDSKPKLSAKALAGIARCEKEQREILSRADAHQLPAWLVTLGWNDWEVEKMLIRKEGNL